MGYHYDSNDRDDGTIYPCPFCKGVADVRAYDPPFTGETYYYVTCDMCGAMTKPAATVAEAIKKWNRRPEW